MKNRNMLSNKSDAVRNRLLFVQVSQTVLFKQSIFLLQMYNDIAPSYLLNKILQDEIVCLMI